MENGHLQFSPYPGELLRLGEEKTHFALLCSAATQQHLFTVLPNPELLIWSRFFQQNQAEPKT